MVADAEKYKAEDDAQKARIDAKNGLEGYVFNLRNTLSDENIAGKLQPADKEAIQKVVDSTIAWMDSNHQVLEKEVYEKKQKEVEAVVNPIMTKIYQAAGGAGGGMPAGFDPSQFAQGGGFPGASRPSSSEPKVEEVD